MSEFLPYFELRKNNSKKILFPKNLEAYTADEAGHELLVTLSHSGPLFRPLVAYLGLFRPASRDLSHERALRLAKEALALLDQGASPAGLQRALTETVEAMRQKRDGGQIKPLTNHNYLKKVLETVGAEPAAVTEYVTSETPAPRGKRAQALASLADWGRAGWLEQALADGLAALLTLGLDGAPAADIVCRTADVWRFAVEKSGCRVEAVDRPRVTQGFASLLQQPLKRWPEPAALVACLPRRPERQKLDEPPLSDAQRAAGKAALDKLIKELSGGM